MLDIAPVGRQLSQRIVEVSFISHFFMFVSDSVIAYLPDEAIKSAVRVLQILPGDALGDDRVLKLVHLLPPAGGIPRRCRAGVARRVLLADQGLV